MSVDLANTATYVLNHWSQIAAYSVGGLSVSVVLQFIKTHYKLNEKNFRLFWLIKLDGPKIVVALLSIFTALAAAYAWLLNPSNAQLIPAHFSFLLTAAFYMHRFLVSPAGEKLAKALKPYFDALEQIKSQANTAAPTTTDTSFSGQNQDPTLTGGS